MPNIKNIMQNWRGGKAPAVKLPTPVAKVTTKKASGGVPGLMATRNNLKSLRTATLPKGLK